MTATKHPPTVTYCPERSTRWTACYAAESRSQPGQVWYVTHDERMPPERQWRCPCEAGRFNRPCDHKAEARRVQTARWWAAIWRECDDLTLYRDDRRLAALVASGEATEEDIIAHGALGDVVAERATQQAA